MLSDISEVLEDFRLYILSYWSDLYLVQSSLSLSNLGAAISDFGARKWLALGRQTLLVQIYVYFALVSIFCLLSVKLWVVLTTGKCRSRARLEGKTVLITGANVGKNISVMLIPNKFWSGRIA